MKNKIIFRVMTTLFSACLSASVLSNYVQAYTYISPTYEINNSEYKECVDSLGGYIPNEEKLVRLLNNCIAEDSDHPEWTWYYAHIFRLQKNDTEDVQRGENVGVIQGYQVYSTFQAEMKRSDTIELETGKLRSFTLPRIVWNSMSKLNEYDVDDLNYFLKENNLKAEIVESSEANSIVYDDDAKLEDIIDVAVALNEKYGCNAMLSLPASYTDIYKDEAQQATDTVTTTPVITSPSETTTVMTVVTDTPKIISGDADSDNELNVRDCSVIANALANGKGDDLPDSADYNKDGNKNIRDAALIARELAEKR